MCKKILFVLVLVFSVHLCPAQSVSDLFSEFSHAENVEKVNLNYFVMTLIRPFIATAELNGLKVKAVQVMDLSDCNPDIKREYSRRVLCVNDEIYETLVQVKDGDETVKVLARNDGEVIRELVVLTTGDDAAYVRLRGNFKIADAQKLAERY